MSLEEKCSIGGAFLIMEYERYIYYSIKNIFFQKFLELVRKSYDLGEVYSEKGLIADMVTRNKCTQTLYNQ